MNPSLRNILITLIILAAIGLGVWYYQFRDDSSTKTGTTNTASSDTDLGYVGAGDTPPTIELFDERIEQVTSIEITPDGSTMFVTTLPGTVWVYEKSGSEFVRATEPFFELETGQPGFPEKEAGLTGIILGVDFETSGDVFLTHCAVDTDGTMRNRVTRVTSSAPANAQGQLTGTDAELIFEANTPAGIAHQIQDGVALFVEGLPHILFPLGEGFEAANALDPSKESGKLILIQRDGSDPSGSRPFADSPTVQAIGIRNAPNLTINQKTGKVAILDTGTTVNDRFLYGTVVDENGFNSQVLSFNWDGTDESLTAAAPDRYLDSAPNMLLHRWSPTETAVNVLFYEHQGLPALPQGEQYVLVTLFGQTGNPANEPGKKILLGTLTHGVQDTIEFSDFIVRAPSAEGTEGNPLGLAVDPSDGTIYFGDLFEQRIYRATLE